MPWIDTSIYTGVEGDGYWKNDDTTPVGIGDFNTDMSTNNPVVGQIFNIDSSTTAKYNGNGTYTITNTETNETSTATQAQIDSMMNPQTSGNASMANLTNATYQEKLKDPRWQKKRLEIFNRDKFTCQWCNHTDRTLHVHHLEYTKSKEPWQYDNDKLQTVCVYCHNFAHENPIEI